MFFPSLVNIGEPGSHDTRSCNIETLQYFCLRWWLSWKHQPWNRPMMLEQRMPQLLWNHLFGTILGFYFKQDTNNMQGEQVFQTLKEADCITAKGPIATMSYIAITSHPISSNWEIVIVGLQIMQSWNTVLRMEEKKKYPKKKDVNLHQ